ncbi:alpha-N-acetylgalactosamine-specific lectin-like isoform X2 [Pomacea canaliculata]|nr:alpha-N-acetylgalactosamine-specific lectin-like isoform X1 [Pomacea canaliculata]XP_025089333.1 alpha-N-acetylgalactosamine-specific lectin-like isoform X2 [Pomacea canaliculata]
MATSRSPRFTFITRVALTFVVIVILGATCQKLNPDEATTNGKSEVGRLSRSAICPCCYGGCPVERGYVLYNNHCLKLYSVKRDYQTARARCQTDGAHLLDFKSREQDGPALLYLLDTMGHVLQGITAGLWVGANDIKVEGRFFWSDGTILTKDNGLWESGQPDDWQNEDCVEVLFRNTVLLNDFTCTSKLGFVCQIDMKK